MRHTIKDIAKQAGVSRGTVDRVLHNRGKVSKDAYDRVTRVLEAIDYKPNQFARSLKNSKEYQIGVLMPDPSKDQYWSMCVEGLRSAVNEFESFGITIEESFFSPTSTSSFRNSAEEILNKNPDAVLMVPLFRQESESFLKKCKEKEIPVVAINTPVQNQDSHHFIGQDLYQSGRVAADLIFQLCQKPGKLIILHVDEDVQNSVHLQQKENGFRDFFKSRSEFDIEVIQTYEKDEAQLLEVLSETFDREEEVTGIFVTTSKVYKMVSVLDKFQYRGPLVGYDLIDENLKYLINGKVNFLINQSPGTQGYLGIRSLSELFSFNKKIPTQKFLPIDIVSQENFRFYI